MRVPRDLERKCLALAGGPAGGRAGGPERVLFHVTLPLPPTANNLFVTRGTRRFKSPEYRAWLAEVEPALRRLRPPESYPCRFRAVITGTVNESRDWDNFVKPLQDAARAAGVIPDDSLRRVRGGLVEYEPSAGPGGVVVWFEPIRPK